MTNLKKSNTPTRERTMSVQHWLLSGASALALVAVAMPAYAQQSTAATADDNTVETVVVTGIKNSLATAQAIKQNSDQFVDSVSAVDIGALPDRTVAEALQRVPGVTLQRTDANRDPSRYVSEPNVVFIRGLSWVQSETNGRDIFSAANGRSLSFADVSADLLSGVDVYKNPDAEMIEGGIGGTVDLRTRKPFDQDGELMAVSGNFDYADLHKKGTASFNGLYSNRWQTGMGEVGFLISVDYQDEANRVNEFGTNPNQCVDGVDAVDAPACATNANRRFIPNVLDTRQLDWEQKRLAVSAVAQWRPNDQWEITLDALRAVADPKDQELNAPFDIPQSLSSSYTYGPQNQLLTASIAGADFENDDTRVGVHHDKTGDYSLHVSFNPNEKWSFSVDGQYIESEATNYSMTALINLLAPFTGPANWGAIPNPVNVNANLSGNNPIVSITPGSAVGSQSDYYWEAAMDHLEDNYAHAYTYRADASYKFAEDEGVGWLKSFDVGYRGTSKQAVTRQTGYNWSLLSQASWGGSGVNAGPVFLNQTGFTGCGPGEYSFPPPNFALTCTSPSVHTDSALPTLSFQKAFGSFFGQTIPSFWFVKPSFLLSGTSNIYNHLKNTETNSFGWTPLNVQAGCPTKTFCLAEFEPSISHAKSDNISGGINNQLEQVKSGYMQVNFAHDSFLGIDKPVSGNFGLRIVDTTETQGPSPLVTNNLSTVCVPQTVAPTTPASPPLKDCTDYNAARTFVQSSATTFGGTTFTAGSVQEYTRLLPSFNLLMHLTDELQFRFAASKAMVRPDFTQTNGAANLNYVFGASTNLNPGGIPTPDLSGTCATLCRTGTGGNPFLKPLDATQFDSSLEYYFAPTGSLTLSVFHKDIKNYVFTTVGLETYTNGFNGDTQSFEVTRPQNGKAGTVEGFEVGYTQFFDGLPSVFGGLGVQANFTKIYSSGGSNEAQNFFDAPEVANAGAALPLEGMSPNSYNVAALYEKYGFSGRLAYNWRSTYLLTSSSVSGQPVWSENYGQLDASLLYSFLDHYKIGLQITNLTHAKTILDIGFTAFHPRYEWIQSDRKFSLVLRANF